MLEEASSNDQRAIFGLARECEGLMNRLDEILKDLSIPTTTRFRRVVAFGKAVKGAGKKKEIDDLERRMNEVDRRLRDTILTMVQKYV